MSSSLVGQASRGLWATPFLSAPQRPLIHSMGTVTTPPGQGREWTGDKKDEE